MLPEQAQRVVLGVPAVGHPQPQEERGVAAGGLEAGLEPSGGDASFFLWMRVPGGEDAEGYALRLLERHGIVIAPGPYFGSGGEGHVRIALVPTPADCRRAADLLASGT